MARWRDLDFEPAQEARTGAQGAARSKKEAPEQRGERRHGPLVGMAPPRHPAVAAARGLYLLKNWQGVVNTVTPEVLQQPEAEGGWLLRALALARLHEETAAEAAFERALGVCPG